ncbi:MAG: hypothetical protein WCB56_05085 [Terriglobales bacterium]|jgi:hypothetical protein
MRVPRGVLTEFVRLLFLCLSIFSLSNFAPAQSLDQAIADRVLGPQWKQMSRRAGMIFAGTVIAAPDPIVTTPTSATQADPAARSAAGPTPAVQLSFRVDEAIAGVEPGQVVTIHEWAGSWFMHPPMSKGQRFLLFLYPTSRLGLTSPVGGSLGQIALDATGKSIVERQVERPPAAVVRRSAASSPPVAPANQPAVTVVQLARAIRSARTED